MLFISFDMKTPVMLVNEPTNQWIKLSPITMASIRISPLSQMVFIVDEKLPNISSCSTLFIIHLNWTYVLHILSAIEISYFFVTISLLQLCSSLASVLTTSNRYVPWTHITIATLYNWCLDSFFPIYITVNRKNWWNGWWASPHI